MKRTNDRDRFWFRLHCVMQSPKIDGFRFAVVPDDPPVIEEQDYTPTPDVALPAGYEWYYAGRLIAMGRSAKGNDFEFDIATGKVSRKASLNEMRRICAYGKRYGDQRAAERFEVPRKTIQQWRIRKPWASVTATRQTVKLAA